MKRLAWFGTAALLVACGGSDDGEDGEDLPNPGFAVPTVTTTAYTGADGNWTEVGPANWSCLGTASDDQAMTVDVTLSGNVEDFQSGKKLDAATVTAYADTNFSGAGVAETVSDDTGAYSLTIPSGSTRIAFKVIHEDALETYALNEIFEPDQAAQNHDTNSVSLLTASALPAFINVTRTVGLGILAGSIVDCDGNEVSGAITTVSTTRGVTTHLEGAQSYYFSALATSLPVRLTQQTVTNTDGLFVVIELPPSPTAFLQVWGFVDGQDPAVDDMTLLGEIPSPVLSDSVITASMEPIRN